MVSLHVWRMTLATAILVFAASQLWHQLRTTSTILLVEVSSSTTDKQQERTLRHPDGPKGTRSTMAPPSLPNKEESDDKSGESSQHQHLLLDVPFYMYEELGMPGDFELDGEPFSVDKLDPDRPLHTVSPLISKHADDALLMKAALDHPLRTTNPALAKLFVVPTPFNMIMDQLRWGGKLCNKRNGKCNEQLVKYANEFLKNSTWFQRHEGKDHIAVVSHWRWQLNFKQAFGAWRPTQLHQCNLIAFEDTMQNDKDHPDRIVFPAYYVGRPCDSYLSTTEKTHDFAMITTLQRHDNNLVFQDRANICKWVQGSNNENETTRFDMPACGPGDQCPALAQAKFGFHAAGDTYGSNRPMDVLLSGSVPVFTNRKQYSVLPPWIDWSQISVFADVSNQQIFLDTLDRLVDDAEGYKHLQRNVMENRDLFDYHSIVPFDTYMYMFQCHRWPELCRSNDKSPYSALKLPSPNKLSKPSNEPKRLPMHHHLERSTGSFDNCIAPDSVQQQEDWSQPGRGKLLVSCELLEVRWEEERFQQLTSSSSSMVVGVLSSADNRQRREVRSSVDWCGSVVSRQSHRTNILLLW